MGNQIIKTVLSKLVLEKLVPQYSGKFEVPKSDFANLSKTAITLYRDDNGVCHVYGKNIYDVYFGQGFGVYQDRGFQYEQLRRIALGRIAELDASLTFLDKLNRTLGFARLGIHDAENAPDEEKKRIQSFLDGFNHALKVCKAKPPAVLTGLVISEFRLAEFYAVVRFLAWNLDIHGWMSKLVISQLQNLIVPEDLNVFCKMSDPSYEKCPQPSAQISTETVSLAKKTDDLKGSNCFAISGEFTANKKPIVSNDTHLGASLPNVFMIFGLHCADLKIDAIGVGYIGGIGVNCGANNYLSYGITLTTGDLYDIYEIEVDLSDDEKPKYKNSKGEMVDFEVIQHVIKAKKKEISYKVLVTEQGPIVSDIWGYKKEMKKMKKDEIEQERKNTKVMYAMKAMCLSKDLKNDISIGSMWTCKSVEEIKEYVHKCQIVSLNFVVGDQKDIAYFYSGAIPKRGENAIKNHSKPLQNTEENTWKGFFDTKDNPQEINPERGYIVSSNHRSQLLEQYMKDNPEKFLGYLFYNDTRAARISKLIEDAQQGKNIDVKICKKIQLDVTVDKNHIAFVCESVARIDDTLKEMYEKEKEKLTKEKISLKLIKLVCKRIKNFGGKFSKSSCAALLYSIYQNRLLYNILSRNEEIKENAALINGIMGCGIDTKFYDSNEFTDKNTNLVEKLFDNEKIEGSLVQKAGGIQWIIFRAVVDCIRYVRKFDRKVLLRDKKKKVKNLSAEEEVSNYHLGDVHKLYFEDLTYKMFHIGPFPSEGSHETVNQRSFWDDLDNDRAMEVVDHAVFRMVVDLAKVFDESCLILDNGQCENPTSEFYASYVEKYVKGEYLPFINLKKEEVKGKRKLSLHFV